MKFAIVATISALLMASSSLAYPMEYYEYAQWLSLWITIPQRLTIPLSSRAEIYRRSGTLTCKHPKDQMVCPNVFQCVGEKIVPKPGVPVSVVALHFACPSRCKCA